MTNCKRPILSPINFRHGPIENTYYFSYVYSSVSIALAMTRTTLKTLLLSELLRNLAKDYLPRICLRGNWFTNPLPSNGCTCNNIVNVLRPGVEGVKETDVNLRSLGSCHHLSLITRNSHRKRHQDKIDYVRGGS
jgi:hypothetical protein